MIKSCLSFFLLLVILTLFFPDLVSTIVELLTRVLELLLRVVGAMETQVAL